MDIYLLVGGSNTRKSSTVRALTGSKAAHYGSKDATREVEYATGISATLVLTSALQESKTSPSEIIAAIKAAKVKAAIMPLRVQKIRSKGKLYDGADIYISAFLAEKWRVHIAEMEAVAIKPGTTRNVPLHSAAVSPANSSAAMLRKKWKIR